MYGVAHWHLWHLCHNLVVLTSLIKDRKRMNWNAYTRQGSSTMTMECATSFSDKFVILYANSYEL